MGCKRRRVSLTGSTQWYKSKRLAAYRSKFFFHCLQIRKNVQKIDKYKYVEWLTKNHMEKCRTSSVIPGLDQDSLVKREIELNMKCFVLDQRCRPRFIEKLLGVTNDQGKIEFVAKFKLWVDSLLKFILIYK